jgi:excinuclease UvrABC nuclease subunit
MELNPRNWNRITWQEANAIPCEPGCYALLDDNENILYIGRSKILWNRLRNPNKHAGFKRTNKESCSLTIAWCSGWDVYDSEQVLIQQWKPPLCQDGIRWKG